MNKIKNIVFDFGGILLDIDIPKALNSMMELIGGDVVDNKEIPPKLKSILEAYEVGSFNTETFIWNIQHVSIMTLNPLQIIKAWNGMLIEMKPHKFEKLLKLREKYNVYLLSNINDLHLNWVYNYFKSKFGIDNWDECYFDKTYYSHIMNKRKPNKSTFEYVWSDAGMIPAESLFIDDTLENIEAANQLGIRTIHHNPKEDIFEVLDSYLLNV